MTDITEDLATVLATTHKSDVAESIGRETFADVMGEEPKGALDVAVNAMDEIEKTEFVRELAARLTLNTGMIGQMIADQGKIDKETLETLGDGTRNKVAFLRMTTRPWAVRWLVRGLLAPFAVIAVDVLFFAINVILRTVGFDINPYDVSNGISSKIFNFTEIVKFYTWYAGWASVAVMSYFGLREYGKSQGHDDTDGTTQAAAGQAEMAPAALAGSAITELRKRLNV